MSHANRLSELSQMSLPPQSTAFDVLPVMRGGSGRAQSSSRMFTMTHTLPVNPFQSYMPARVRQVRLLIGLLGIAVTLFCLMTLCSLTGMAQPLGTYALPGVGQSPETAIQAGVTGAAVSEALPASLSPASDVLKAPVSIQGAMLAAPSFKAGDIATPETLPKKQAHGRQQARSVFQDKAFQQVFWLIQPVTLEGSDKLSEQVWQEISRSKVPVKTAVAKPANKAVPAPKKSQPAQQKAPH